MPTAIIADDEDLQRSDLRRMLAQVWPELRIVARCEDGGAALAAIAQHQPDVAFLDIRMPDLSGIEVARASAAACRMVFTTAYDGHAIEAFELGAIDYLLKPIQHARLSNTVARLRAQITAGERQPDRAPELARLLRALDQRLGGDTPVERIRWVSASAGNVIKMFPIEEILFFESDARYTRVVSATDEGYIRTPIKELQKGLDPELFWQIHRGTVVSVRAIARARRDELGNLTVELRGHAEPLRVSQSYAWRFRNEVSTG